MGLTGSPTYLTTTYVFYTNEGSWHPTTGFSPIVAHPQGNREHDLYMLLNCVHTKKSIIQLPSLVELQYNNGYWWDRTEQGTSGKLKE